MKVWDLLSLKGKVILVTGGAGNYGRSIVEGLAEAGGTVIIASRDLQKVEEVAAHFRKEGHDVVGMQVDQGEVASVNSLKQEILSKYKKLDVFVNNAVSRPMKGFNAPIEQFAESMRVNATGMMYILREMSDFDCSEWRRKRNQH